MSIQTVNEATTAYLTVTFLDKDGAQAAPSSVSYRIDCLTTGAAVRASTPVTPAASQVEITLDATDNAMQSTGNLTERRRVTVTASYGVGDQVQEQYDYLVKNLSEV